MEVRETYKCTKRPKIYQNKHTYLSLVIIVGRCYKRGEISFEKVLQIHHLLNLIVHKVINCSSNRVNSVRGDVFSDTVRINQTVFCVIFEISYLVIPCSRYAFLIKRSFVVTCYKCEQLNTAWSKIGNIIYCRFCFKSCILLFTFITCDYIIYTELISVIHFQADKIHFF